MKKYNIIVSVLFIALLFYIDPVYAGPGGVIAKGLAKTWWGKLLLVLLFILLFPFIAYNWVIETLKVKKTKKQLLKISVTNNDFTWLNLEKNFSNIITRVYAAWGKGDMSEVKNYVNHWYWQNQQSVHLNKWDSENLKNICNLKKVTKVKPIYVELTNNENFEGSKIVIHITANIEDYLIKKDTKKIVEGKKGFQEETHVWVMEYTENKWLLDSIKNEDHVMEFLKLDNVIPEKYTAMV